MRTERRKKRSRSPSSQSSGESESSPERKHKNLSVERRNVIFLIVARNKENKETKKSRKTNNQIKQRNLGKSTENITVPVSQKMVIIFVNPAAVKQKYNLDELAT